jgi:hypothetical protein
MGIQRVYLDTDSASDAAFVTLWTERRSARSDALAGWVALSQHPARSRGRNGTTTSLGASAAGHKGAGVMANTRQTGSRLAGETRDAGTSHAGRFEHDRRPDHVDPRKGLRARQRRQREEFGGLHWGGAFFGWLVAVGIATLLTALLSAAGAAVGLTRASTQDAAGNADTLGILGGVLLLGILLVAYYAGGYVAGRMSRFAGPRQGLGVWIIGLIVTVILAVAGALLGANYNVLSQLNLPRIPIDEGALTTGGLIALAAITLGTLLAAIAGGKAGTHFHRKVDRAGLS